MNKQELMEYMKVVCDGEAAVYACDETIAALQAKKQTWLGAEPCPSKPSLPKENDFYRAPQISASDRHVDHDAGGKALWGCLPGLLVFIPWFTSAAASSWGYGLFVILICGIGFPLITGLLVKLAERSDDQSREAAIDREYEHAREQAKRKYAEAMKEYDRKNSRRNAALDAEAARQSTLDHIIAGYTAHREELFEKLSKVYSSGIIHDRFRNIVAVNQIREYLEMGVCDSLEGPNGALALYYQDLRAERICGSIDDLKKAMVNAIEHLNSSMSGLIHEVRTTNSNIRALESSLGEGLSHINSRMEGLQSALPIYADQVTTAISSVNSNVESMNRSVHQIEKATSASAHNEYIALREVTMDNYLRFRYKDPT